MIFSRVRWRHLARSPKAMLTVLLGALFVIAAAGPDWRVKALHVALALAGASAVDVVAYRRLRRSWRWPSSALLSGAIVAFVLGPETPPAVTAIVAGGASASKYLFRARAGHLFNPAALALLVSIPAFGTAHSWWGALGDAAPVWTVVLVAGGAAIADRINKLPLVLTFGGVTYALFTVASLSVDHETRIRLAEMFRQPFLQATLFLAFVMLSDPPTAPGGYVDQVWVGGLAGVASVVAQLLGAGQAYLLVGLLVGNLALAVRLEYRRRALAEAAAQRMKLRGGRSVRLSPAVRAAPGILRG